tara:strand:- start:10051 stop:10548 length:498 start_codon:yes stop_codon:yes gene_type:complete
MTTTVPTLRPIPFDLAEDARITAVDSLNAWLVDLIALGLRLKQSHWNLRGTRFQSVHEQLDEILVDVRNATDDIAERVVTLGAAADGRPSIVAKHMTLKDFPSGQLTVEQAIRASCGDLGGVIQHGRTCLEAVGRADPISEDLVISVLSALEKHHWMLDAQRDEI